MSRSSSIGRVLSLCALAGGLSIVAFAQQREDVWLTGVTGSATVRNGSRQLARQRARLDAYAQALRKLGIPFSPSRFEIQAEAGGSPEHLRRANDAFLLTLRGRSGGFVSAARNVKEDLHEESGTVFCTTTLDARITRPRGTVDHGFYVQLSAPSATVVAGENVRVRAVPSKESFVYLFHIMTDGVRLLYPPAIDSDVAMPAGAEITVPVGAGGAWIAELPEEWESSEELVIAIATRSKIPEANEGIVDPLVYGSAREGVLMELLGWLSALPLQDVTESSIRIEIVRN